VPFVSAHFRSIFLPANKRRLMKEIDSTARVEQRTRQKDEKTETKPAGPTSPSRRFEKIITVGSETGVGDGLWTRTSIMMSRYNWLPQLACQPRSTCRLRPEPESQSLEDYPRFPAELDLDWVNPWLTLLQQLHWLPIKHRTDFKIANITFRILFMLPNRLICVRPCMPVIPLVPSDSPTLIFSLLRLSAPHLALADTALQPLKSGTLSLYLTVPVPVLTPFVVTSRPTTASRHSTPLNPSPLAPQIRLWTIVCVYKLYLLTLS